MSRQRQIYKKLDDTDALDESDQSELLTALREDLSTQQKTLRTIFSILLLITIGCLIFGLRYEEDGGALHNLVYFTTYKEYDPDMFNDSFITCLIVSIFTLISLWLKYYNVTILIALCVPFLTYIIEYFSGYPGYPLLPIIFLVFPIMIYSILSHNYDLWSHYRHLETLQYKYKGV
ncbi:hypothetical protein WA158_001421 [Blastocystis sp. Blastoise]